MCFLQAFCTPEENTNHIYNKNKCEQRQQSHNKTYGRVEKAGLQSNEVISFREKFDSFPLQIIFLEPIAYSADLIPSNVFRIC